MSKFNEPYWSAWAKWHLYRRRRGRPWDARIWQFRKWLRRQKPGLVIDGGANIGEVTEGFLRYGFHSIAFEPDPLAIEVLQKKFDHDTRVTLHPKALGGSARTAFLHRNATRVSGSTTESSLLARPELNGETIEVEVVDIVEFLEGLKEPVAVLKLDIEGAEAEVLERLLDAGWDRKIGRIFVETHDRFSTELAARLDAIRTRLVSQGISNIELDWI